MLLSYKIHKNEFILYWDNNKNAKKYRIMGMTQTFSFIYIDICFNNEYSISHLECQKFLQFKVIAENENWQNIDESNTISINKTNIEEFEIWAIDWYYWTSISIRSKKNNDLYKVYYNEELIAETEDPILTLSYKITKNQLKKIFVEAYTKNENWYILCWLSWEIRELPLRKKSEYKISIVIPVYNAQLFLPRTIDSILCSSMKDIEIILVDDWSNDDSYNICKWYSKTYSCISVIKQNNQKVSKARNKWISVAKWEYIWFVDNDDIVNPYMYEILYKACKSRNSDIAIAPTIIREDINSYKICLEMPERNENIVEYSYKEMIENINKKNRG